MAVEIHLKPSQVWDYFRKNKDRLEKELVEVAVNTDTGTSIFLTDEDDLPYMYVYQDEKKIFQQSCCTACAAEVIFQNAYKQWMPPAHLLDEEEEIVEEDEDPYDEVLDIEDIGIDEDEGEDLMGEIDEREATILDAFKEFLTVLTEDDLCAKLFEPKFDKNDAETLDHIVAYLAITKQYRIRRPMLIIDDETGLTVFCEYPYEEYDVGEEYL